MLAAVAIVMPVGQLGRYPATTAREADQAFAAGAKGVGAVWWTPIVAGILAEAVEQCIDIAAIPARARPERRVQALFIDSDLAVSFAGSELRGN
jgi:hypothetical protein